MKIFLSATATACILFANGRAQAAEQTVVLDIPTMDCATCPIIIRTALMKVAGVSGARVEL